MKIAMVNGSQKTGESNSGLILDRLNNLIKEKHEVEIYKSGISNFTEETNKRIVSADVIILSFPLFVYSVPSHTLKMLIGLENTIKQEKVKNLIIYAIINCGFYEGKQNNAAFKIIENWCERSGVKFGGGIGQGAGEMLGATKNFPPERSLFKNTEQALHDVAQKLETKEMFGIIYLDPQFPQFAWKFMATRNWNSKARKNGLTKKDIKKRL
jgi:multimeric flavodoxin WrbA